MNIQITEHNKDVVVFDIDGCIVNSDERLPHFLNGDRETYDKLHPTDKSMPAGHAVYQTLMSSMPHVHFLFVTGRRETCRNYTEAQLIQMFGPCVTASQLLMRPVGCDAEHDTTLKPRLIEEAGYSLDRILLVIEDRDSTVAMWRERGITCWQTQSGPF